MKNPLFGVPIYEVSSAGLYALKKLSQRKGFQAYVYADCSFYTYSFNSRYTDTIITKWNTNFSKAIDYILRVNHSMFQNLLL